VNLRHGVRKEEVAAGQDEGGADAGEDEEVSLGGGVHTQAVGGEQGQDETRNLHNERGEGDGEAGAAGGHPYRLVMLRKRIMVAAGRLRLADEIRNSFHITNSRHGRRGPRKQFPMQSGKPDRAIEEWSACHPAWRWQSLMPSGPDGSLLPWL
jgi:hypothetical protein